MAFYAVYTRRFTPLVTVTNGRAISGSQVISGVFSGTPVPELCRTQGMCGVLNQRDRGGRKTHEAELLKRLWQRFSLLTMVR